MDILALSEDTADAWREIALSSDEGWFWHTPEWLGFVKAIGADAFVADLSFLVVRDRVPLAICPVILETREGYRRFSYLGEFVPYPALKPQLDESTAGKVIAEYSAQLDRLAAQHDVAYARVIVPSLSEAANVATPAWNPLLRHGFLDISGASQVVSLTPDMAALWHDVRKGHRSDVKRAASQCAITVWDAATITDAKFDEYRTLHAIDAGRVTRAVTTFDMMLGWVRSGNAVLIEARRGEQVVVFAVLILFRDGAYYASSCKLPGLDVPAMHLIQWEAITWLKSRGIARYDLGMQYFGPAWSHVPSAKDLSIAKFKRGFGGATKRLDVVEKFYSPAVMERVGRARVSALAAAAPGIGESSSLADSGGSGQ